ncbi:hypothetical protein VE03_10668, partial [Pseudogymnoascus sp. 23342-1-I1]
MEDERDAGAVFDFGGHNVLISTDKCAFGHSDLIFGVLDTSKVRAFPYFCVAASDLAGSG